MSNGTDAHDPSVGSNAWLQAPQTPTPPQLRWGGSVHLSHQGGVLPAQQAPGGTEAHQAALDFPGVRVAIVRQRHDALAIDETSLACRALGPHLQVSSVDVRRMTE